MAVPVMDPKEQAEIYGFSYPPLPPRGLDPNIDRALDMVQQDGTSPALIRELDAWTGQTHFAYTLPGGDSSAGGNVNMWVVRDGDYIWLDSSGSISSPPTWAPPKPNADLETGQYDIQRPVEVTYPGATQTVRLEQPRYAPSGYDVSPGAATFDVNTGTWRSNSVVQTDAKIGATNTSVPSGTQTKPQTVGNLTGALTMDEQVQAAALAGSGRTELNWDEWGFYYKQIYGDAAPDPESRGYARAEDGQVYIAGKPRYAFETWKDAAFGSGMGPGGAPGGAGNGNGAGDGNGAGGVPSRMNWPLAIIAAFVGGDAAFSKYSSWPK